jgi:hypothetical protein
MHCNTPNDVFIFSQSPQSYEHQVQRVEDIERENPLRFLRITGNYSENFWGNKYNIDFTIINNATVAQYKDVTMRVTYYTKTNSVLTTQDHTIYEYFPPTSSKEFHLKFPTYSDATHIDLTLIQAKSN